MKLPTKEQKLKYYYITRVRQFAAVATRRRVIYVINEHEFTTVQQKQMDFLKNVHRFEIKDMPKQLVFNF
jgi:hypothetical protein